VSASESTTGFGTPSMRRVYDYWLGGRDNFAADREQAARIEAAYPPLPAGQVPVPRRNVRASRAFLERAVGWVAREGVAQFAQLCCGPPPPSHYTPLHEVARLEVPGARFAYADGDRVTTHILREAMRGQDVAVVEGSSAEPDAMLPALKEHIDFGEPAAIIASMVLQCLPAERAREVTAAYAGALSPGSYLIVSCPVCDDPQLWERLRPVRTLKAWNHSPAVIESFFGGLELIPPGLVMARAWKPQRGPVGMTPDAASYVLAGVGRKP
jgi:S-adenosyl methyltransferase